MNYKKRKRDEKISSSIDASKADMKEILTPVMPQVQSRAPVPIDLLGIKELATATSLSVRTIYRLMKEKDFPRLKIKGRLLFKKNDVIDYLTLKYGNV